MSERNTTEEQFCKLAERYDDWFKTDEGRYIDSCERNALLEFLHPNSADTVLDIRTGTGIYFMDAARHDAYIVGIDFSEGMLRVLKRKLIEEDVKRYAELVRGDAAYLPFRPTSFTKVICNTVLEFIPKPQDAISDFSRIHSKNGEVVIGILTSTSTWAFRRWLRNRSKFNIYSDVTFYSLNNLKRLLKHGNFKIKQHRWAVFAPPGTPKKLYPIFEKVDRFLCMKPVLGSLGAFLAIKAVHT